MQQLKLLSSSVMDTPNNFYSRFFLLDCSCASDSLASLASSSSILLKYNLARRLLRMKHHTVIVDPSSTPTPSAMARAATSSMSGPIAIPAAAPWT
eukprot:761512-Hanusia_phi.AAC.5